MLHQRYRRLEVQDADNHQLGVGAYGVVYKALDTKDGRMVAQKKIKLEGEDEGIPATALREISNLKMLVHPNVVRLLDAIREPGKLYLIFELMDSDLKKYMESCADPLPLSIIRSFTTQIFDGLSFCHCMGVMHRDLKPQNILVSRSGCVKLADFGLSRAFTPVTPARPLTIEVITRWYRSPDLLLGSNKYLPAVDVWSVGCILVEMSNKRALFPGDSEIDQIHRIFRCLGTPTEATWPGCADLPYWRPTFPKWPDTSSSATTNQPTLCYKANCAYCNGLSNECDSAITTSTITASESAGCITDFSRPSAVCNGAVTSCSSKSIWAALAPRLPPTAHDLLSRIFVFDCGRRISALQALEHPFLASSAATGSEKGDVTSGNSSSAAVSSEKSAAAAAAIPSSAAALKAAGTTTATAATATTGTTKSGATATAVSGVSGRKRKSS